MNFIRQMPGCWRGCYLHGVAGKEEYISAHDVRMQVKEPYSSSCQPFQPCSSQGAITRKGCALGACYRNTQYTYYVYSIYILCIYIYIYIYIPIQHKASQHTTTHTPLQICQATEQTCKVQADMFCPSDARVSAVYISAAGLNLYNFTGAACSHAPRYSTC